MYWTHQSDRLVREFRFADFRAAWSFLTDVAAEAERRDHHPGIWNEYGYVRLELCTHDAGRRVTVRDEFLARAIDRIADHHGARPPGAAAENV
jgi:4a-hydroxytetrahydrobiopterin dehydratase